MRLFALTIILASLACLAPTPQAFAQDAEPELIADLQKWLVGSWLCQYSPSIKAQAIYGKDKQFEWIFRIGRPPYVTVIRQMGSYDIITPGNDGYQAAVLATSSARCRKILNSSPANRNRRTLPGRGRTPCRTATGNACGARNKWERGQTDR